MILTWLHLIIILLSSVLLLFGVFPDALWFDEAYSLCLLAQPLSEMIASASADVHPFFFYLSAKVVLFLCGLNPFSAPETSILVLRIFSILPICLLTILGFTHVRRWMGSICGLLFSLFVGFSPSTLYQAVQIRMYSWAAFFVFCAFLAAFPIGIMGSDKRPPRQASPHHAWGSLAFFSLLAAYTHYYALAAVAFLQIFLLLLSWKQRKQLLRPWLITVLWELFFYLPGFFILYRQASNVSSGYWITMQYPDIFLEILTFFQRGALPFSLVAIVSGIFLSLLAVLFFVFHKRWNPFRKKAALYCFLPLFSVCAFGLLVSLIRPLFIPRYLFPICGMYWLLAALILSSLKKKWIPLLCCIFFFFLGIKSAKIRLASMTDPQNNDWKQVILQNGTSEDAFFFSDLNVGCQAAVFFADHPLYFYNEFSWNEKNGRMGFSNLIDWDPENRNRPALSPLRLWVIDSEKNNLSSRMPSEFSCILPKVYCFHPYSGQWINLSLWQKGN